MKQIYFDIGVENVLFIRYNPDAYKGIDGQRVFSGARRQEFLVKYLRQCERMQGLGVVYLFYDGFMSSSVEVEVIDPYLSD